MLVDAVSPVANDAALDNNPSPTLLPETLGRRKLHTGEGRVLLGASSSIVGTTVEIADLK